MLLGVRLGDARVLVDAPDGVAELHDCLGRTGRAGDRRRLFRPRAADQRYVALAGQEPGRGVEADPAGARHVHLGPGVQVGEIGDEPACLHI